MGRALALGSALLLGILSCRGKGTLRADRELADARATAPSASVSIAPDPSTTPAPVPPPKLGPFLGPRDAPFALVEIGYTHRGNDVRGARPDVLAGIDARVMDARLEALVYAPTLIPVPSSLVGHIMWTIKPMLVTRRILSVETTRFDLTLDAAAAAKGMGGAAGDATVQYENWAFEHAEGPPIELELDDLFTPGVDAREVVKKACEELWDKEAPSEDPSADPPCTPHAFLLSSDGLSVFWSRAAYLAQSQIRSVEIPWEKLAPHIRRSGPVCSFQWETSDDAPLDAGSTDPCR